MSRVSEVYGHDLMIRLYRKVIVEAKEKATNDAASLDRQIAVVQQHQISAMDTTEIQHKILHTHLQHESAVVTRIDSNVEKSLRQQDQMAHQMSTLVCTSPGRRRRHRH